MRQTITLAAQYAVTGASASEARMEASKFTVIVKALTEAEMFRE